MIGRVKWLGKDIHPIRSLVNVLELLALLGCGYKMFTWPQYFDREVALSMNFCPIDESELPGYL
jgi:hypothetical protein